MSLEPTALGLFVFNLALHAGDPEFARTRQITFAGDGFLFHGPSGVCRTTLRKALAAEMARVGAAGAPVIVTAARICVRPHGGRVGAYVDAAVVTRRDASGRATTAEMLATAAHQAIRSSAYRMPEDALETRGYRLDADARVGLREIALEGRAAETAWLDEHVYASRWNAKAPGPHVETVDWSTRHG